MTKNNRLIKTFDGCPSDRTIEAINHFQPIRKGKIDLTTGECIFEDGMREFMNLKHDNDSFVPNEFNTNFKPR